MKRRATIREYESALNFAVSMAASGTHLGPEDVAVIRGDRNWGEAYGPLQEHQYAKNTNWLHLLADKIEEELGQREAARKRIEARHA